MTTRQQLRHRFGTRTAVITAAAAGFLVGAGGFAAAQIGPEATTSMTLDVSSTPKRADGVRGTVSGRVETAARLTVSGDSSSTSVVGASSTSIPDASSTSIPDASSTSIPDASSTSIPDASSTSIPDASSTSIPDASSTSIPDASSTSAPVPSSTAVALPGAFTETYASAGGSVTVAWSGTAFTLQAVQPAAGFHAEIEDHAWDRIRVDFEGDDADARVQVRLDDGRIRTRID